MVISNVIARHTIMNKLLGKSCVVSESISSVELANIYISHFNPTKKKFKKKNKANLYMRRVAHCKENLCHCSKKASKTFYMTQAWRTLRYKVLEQYDGECNCCGRSKKKHNVVLHVDHIKPRSIFPELELEISNLQLLCEDCNLGKMNKFDTDWR